MHMENTCLRSISITVIECYMIVCIYVWGVLACRYMYVCWLHPKWCVYIGLIRPELDWLACIHALMAKCHLMSNTRLLILFSGRTF